MIKLFYKDEIIKHLAALFTYGLENKYSFSAIEEYICDSKFINDLENNKYDIETRSVYLIEETYNVVSIKDYDISYKGLFLAESYIQLFFSLNRSFEYLFLYWPFEDFVYKYNVYHEMDFTNLKEDFLAATKKGTLLKKLCKRKNIKLSEIHRLTGINENSLKHYSLKDNNLYNASIDTLFKLSRLFEVKINIFVSNIEVYLDDFAYISNKSNVDYRNHLAFNYGCYYDLSLNEKDFEYRNGYFKNKSVKEGYDVKILDGDKDNLDIEYINKTYKKNDYLIIFLKRFGADFSKYTYLREAMVKEVIIISKDDIYIVKKNKTKEITNSVNNSLIIKAKDQVKSLGK